MPRRLHIVLADTTLAQLDSLRERYNLSTLTDAINYAVAAAYWEQIKGDRQND